MSSRPTNRRHFLLLQGLATPFFSLLAEHLRAAGCFVHKVHIAGSDVAFWRGPAISFRGRPVEWPGFIEAQCKRLAITDLVLFGDCRPAHRAAIAHAKEAGIAVHVFEEGYVRPSFITLERNGTNGYSHFPRDPAVIRERAGRLPTATPSKSLPSSFLNRARWDVLAQATGLLLTPLFPHYRWHGTAHPIVEYLGFLRRFALLPFRLAQSRRILARMAETGAPYVLLPLQLDSDFQIRVHSPYGSMLEAVEEVVASLARDAPLDLRLLLKLHPLDPGLVPYRSRIKALAHRNGVADRVDLVSSGDLESLLAGAIAVVVVNSTVGITSLKAGKPVKALGTALYDLQGLTFAGPLDAFWTHGKQPDDTLFTAFEKLLVHDTQIEGDFFTADGLTIASRNAAERLLSE